MQNSKNDTFCRSPVVSAQCVISTEKYPDGSVKLKYDYDGYSQGYAQIKEVFKALTKDNIPKSCISDDDFRSSIAGVDEVGYVLYVFDIRYQENFTNSPTVKVEILFDGVVPNVINAYALVSTNNLVSVSSDGQRYFDLI